MKIKQSVMACLLSLIGTTGLAIDEDYVSFTGTSIPLPEEDAIRLMLKNYGTFDLRCSYTMSAKFRTHDGYEGRVTSETNSLVLPRGGVSTKVTTLFGYEMREVRKTHPTAEIYSPVFSDIDLSCERVEAGGGQPSNDCPSNYINISANPDVGVFSDFCVMKYEAKRRGRVAESTPYDLPWVQIDRTAAVKACRENGLGYDLISNGQWQAVAREIEGHQENWYRESLNRGHIDKSPRGTLEASEDDQEACYGTGALCSLSRWNDQKRTHFVKSGEVIWDMSGNVWEWVSSVPFDNADGDSYVVEKEGRDKKAYGPKGFYSTRANLGFVFGKYWSEGDGIFRGSGWEDDQLGGVFSAFLNDKPTTRLPTIGFRCVYTE